MTRRCRRRRSRCCRPGRRGLRDGRRESRGDRRGRRRATAIRRDRTVSKGLGHLGSDFVAGAADRGTEGGADPLGRGVVAGQPRHGRADDIGGAAAPTRMDRGDDPVAGEQDRYAVGGPDQQPGAGDGCHQAVARTEFHHLVATGGDLVNRSAVDLIAAPESPNPVVQDGCPDATAPWTRPSPVRGRRSGDRAVAAHEDPIATHESLRARRPSGEFLSRCRSPPQWYNAGPGGSVIQRPS